MRFRVECKFFFGDVDFLYYFYELMIFYWYYCGVFFLVRLCVFINLESGFKFI